MASASSAQLGTRHTPPRSGGLRAAPRLRWEQLARAAMLCVLVALMYLYLSAGVQMFSSWRQSRRDAGAVQKLEGERSALVHQRSVLEQPETVEIEARRLGMIKKGEQPYLIGGLPRN